MNLEKLTDNEVKALRRMGWAYEDLIQELAYNDDIRALHEDRDGIAHIAYFAAIDLCRECSRELEKRGVEE